MAMRIFFRFMFGRLNIQPIIVMVMWLLTCTQTFYPRPLYQTVSNLLPPPFISGKSPFFRAANCKSSRQVIAGENGIKAAKRECIKGGSCVVFSDPSIRRKGGQAYE